MKKPKKHLRHNNKKNLLMTQCVNIGKIHEVRTNSKNMIGKSKLQREAILHSIVKKRKK